MLFLPHTRTVHSLIAQRKETGGYQPWTLRWALKLTTLITMIIIMMIVMMIMAIIILIGIPRGFYIHSKT